VPPRARKVRWIASGTLSDIFGLVYRSIGAWQIMLLNNRRLPGGFVVGRLDTWLLWVTVITGLGAVGVWPVTVLPIEIAKTVRRLGCRLRVGVPEDVRNGFCPSNPE
jgi:hypothetical protein